jgi:hypothetical protein
MFGTSYVHRQKDDILHAALYGMLFMHLCKQLHKCSLGIAKLTKGNHPPLVNFLLVGLMCK